MPIDLIVLAAIAVFVLLRLYGVLGQDVGHDKTNTPKDTSFDASSKVIELTPQQLDRSAKDTQRPAVEPEETVPDTLVSGVRAVRNEDRSFRLKEFLEGAKTAFDMVLEAFAKDDRDTLKMLLSKELYEAFLKELKARNSADEYVETTLISVLEADPVSVEMDGKKAVIKVKFVSEQISVNRTVDGDTVKDSTSAIEKVEDMWTFTRDTRSNNPNWKIIAT